MLGTLPRLPGWPCAVQSSRVRLMTPAEQLDATPIRLLLLEDHVSVRETLALLLAAQPDMEVVAEAGTIAEARRLLPDANPDIALIDLGLPDGSGVEFVRDMRRNNRESRVIVLTGLIDLGEHGRAIEAGAACVLHKSAPIQKIVDAIRSLADGRVVLDPDDALKLMRLAEERRQQSAAAETAVNRLTPREKELLQLLAYGHSDKEIAVRMGLQAKTVRNHMTGLLDALGAESRLQALVLAIRYGIIDISDWHVNPAAAASFPREGI